jgi:acyl-CoA thioesterase-1
MGKVYSLSILAVLAMLVSGCHSNGTANPGPESHQDASAVSAPASAVTGPEEPSNASDAEAAGKERSGDSRPVLVCFGDSLTAGLGTDPGQSYPDYLQADLDQLHYHYRVDNQGVSGNTTKDGVERLPDVLALHPAVVVVEFGGNDGLRGLPIAESRANLDKIVGDLKSSGADVALAGITLPPDYGADYIRQFNETYTVVAKKYRVPMLPFLLKNVYGVPGMMQRDSIHATAKGNQIVARNVMPLVLPMLKK